MVTAARPLLLRRARWVWSGSASSRVLREDVDVLVQEGMVRRIGRIDTAPPDAEVIDASGWLVLPGFVNAHHHLSQQLTRTRAAGAGVLDWLAACYPLWSRLDAEAVHAATRAALAELVLTGVTTTADLAYYFPRGTADAADAQIEAARETGIRLVLARGTMRTVGPHVGARVGDDIDAGIESTEEYIAELARLREAYHDDHPRALIRLAAGATEPIWDDPAAMRSIADTARDGGMRLHTHLHPRPDDLTATDDDPIRALRSVGWWGPHVWVAHGTRLDDRMLAAMATDGVALSTSPSSNARFGSPIAPAARLDRAGGIVAVGVDGGASNDSGDFLGECRLVWQMQRTRDPELIGSPTRVLEWATTGGARALGWDGLGVLAEGAPADIACFALDDLDHAGADDPLAALLLCGLSPRAQCVIIDGRQVVGGGRLLHLDEGSLADAIRAQEERLHLRTFG